MLFLVLVLQNSCASSGAQSSRAIFFPKSIAFCGAFSGALGCAFVVLGLTCGPPKIKNEYKKNTIESTKKSTRNCY